METLATSPHAEGAVTGPFTVPTLHAAYAAGLAPEAVVDEVLGRLKEADDDGIFLYVESRASLLAQASALGPFDPAAKPLWGIPFAVKDNIDVGGRTTTAACPAYAYTAERDAFCVAALRAAGAILIGKTNLDQFATGLVGLRTPFPAPRNAVDPSLAPGGSSSGSAVAVARGIVAFALGTDTAGSGRVPAAYNNIVGLKPTLGAISSTGVVPACRSLDTVSVLALTVDDAYLAYRAAARPDPEDAYSRSIATGPLSGPPPSFRIGVPDAASREFFGDADQERSFLEALRLVETLGGDLVELDFAPFYETAQMLYEGPWVAERFAVLEDMLAAQPEAVHPVTREIIEKGRDMSAADLFRAIYRLKALEKATASATASLDALCVPTIPTFYTVDEIAADPVGTNARLGTYTNFVNLLDMCGIAVPTPLRADGRPGSITLLARAGRDAAIAALAREIHARSGTTLGATGASLPQAAPLSSGPAADEIELAVVGAHMSGMPLNGELTRLGARFLRATRTAPFYRLHALAGGPPFKPGLVRDSDGAAVELETWAVPKSRFGAFMDGVKSPLGIGTLTLESGEEVKGFLCEAAGLKGAREITAFGGWRSYMAAMAAKTA
ncbi:allophanate hydrolase [Rhodobium orientis]|uniref:Allophanate hydrolase n=1 Tax=Rhodobium orientis TaxID=34017 RepID=A0A327JWH6_9HYPH|nr:allophanate hydrolase [Rhodobium orientis]MBB4302788.1 allophanate hydrolase [Rhodobium orientis]MBK5948568.1 allophanate hydrolase [Rhodobium orientis]RAI29833.1 allophanate hydrolase [Rhodobium orientis]